MSEREAIEKVDEPVTKSKIVSDLRNLGLRKGSSVLLHSSLSSLGWVPGGPQAVVEGFRETLSASGALVMPVFTGQYGDPREWSNPSVPPNWIVQIREELPPFRPGVTPSRGMGKVPECFRSYSDVLRSRHPEFSFAAWGADAEELINNHSLDFGLGNDSPLGEIYCRDFWILLLGVGHESNTSLHLAEYRADTDKEIVERSSPLMENGERVISKYRDIPKSDEDFEEIGREYESENDIKTGTVGAARAKLIRQSDIVDYGVRWLEENR